MISLKANGHAWRRCLCGAIECGHDYDEESVRALFDQAAAWAKKNHIPFTPSIDHAAAFLETRDRQDVEPAIPRHVRLYCAEKTELKVGYGPLAHAPRHDEHPRAAPKPVRKAKPQHLPSVTMRA